MSLPLAERLLTCLTLDTVRPHLADKAARWPGPTTRADHLKAGRGCRVEGSPFDLTEGDERTVQGGTNAKDVKSYVSIFKGSKIRGIARYDEEGAKAAGRPKGSVMTVAFGGPIFKFTEAISFVVNCETQREVDHFWEKLSAGGQEVQCGWLKDRFGVSWQVVPTVLAEMLQDKDREKSKRVMAAMLKMKKIEIGGLKRTVTRIGH